MTAIVYHNPRCSKSRETVKLLEARHIPFQTRLYLTDVPSEAEIKQVLKALGFASARELMRSKEALYKELNLAEVDSEQALIAALHAHPKLIERPVVIVGDKAKIGRPPESVLALFD